MPEVHAATYNPNGCASPKATGPDGIAYPAGKNPTDGSGLWSNVVGCDANGGGFTGVQVLGFNATATGAGATAMGFSAMAAQRSTAVGMQAGAMAMGSTALGQWARATALGSVAIGGNTSSNTQAAGAQASGLNAVAIAGESRAMGADSVAVGTRAEARRDGDVAIGVGSVADGAAGNFSAVAIGRNSTAIGENSVAFGNANRATGPGAVALGNSSAAAGASALAIGDDANALAARSISLGFDSVASNSGDVALGAGSATAAAVGTSGIAIAGRSYSFAGSAPTSTVSVGSTGAERTITNVAAGRLDALSTDAINGSQLRATNQAVNALGDRAVTYDGNTGDPKGLITLAGPASTDGGATGGTKLSNLARGTVSAASTEAVNGSQLYETNQDVLRIGDTLTNMGDTVTNLGGTLTNLTKGTNQINKLETGLGIRYARTNESGLTEDDAYAQGVGSTALGYNARATADNALALGRDAQAGQAGSVALGSGSVSTRALAPITGSIAVGSGGALVPFNTADLTLLGEVSVGRDGAYRQITNVADGTAEHDAVTLRQLSGAIGSLTSTGTQYFHANSVAPDSLAIGVDSIAIGPQTVVNGDRGLGIGGGTVVDQSAPGGIALGQQARTTSADGIAMGTQALADAVQGVALGAGSKVTAGGGVALGAGSIAKVVAGVAGYVPQGADGAAVNATRSKLAAVSVGDVDAGSYRQITGVAAGTVDSDAVNVSQLKALASNVSGLDAGGVKYDVNPGGTVNYGMVTLNPGGSATVLKNVARGDLSADSTDAVNGSQLFETNQNIKSIGDTIDNFTKGGAGIKYFHANGGAAAALPDSQANGLGSIAMGPGAVANGGNSVALGNGAAAGRDGDVALGAGAVADRGAENYAGRYSDTQNNSVGTVSVGSSGAERTLSNLADGREATDAVNLRQLDGALKQANDYTDKRLQDVAGNIVQVGDQLIELDARTAAVESDVANISNGAAGMFQTSQEAKATKPPKASGSNSVAGGAGAVASGRNSTAIGNDAQASGAGATALGNGSNASGSNAVALGAGSVADRDNTVSVGAAGSERQIANVARGTAGTDAVNVNQLREIETGMNNQVAGLRKDVQRQDNRLSAGVASAMAMSALPQAYLPGRSMFSMGGGAWRGESGFAMGLSTVSDSGKWVVKGLASSSSRGDYGASVGVGYQW
ncbi:YadA-like family protein [Achromobacter aegrifaciens]